MQTQNLHYPYEIEFIHAESCPIKPHKHTFFEVVYILGGEGIYHINQNEYAYAEDHLFLINKADVHYTTVKHSTPFLFIRFNSMYVEEKITGRNEANKETGIRQLEYLLQNGLQNQGIIFNSQSDRTLARTLVNSILQEHQQESANQVLITQLINTLLTLIARNSSIEQQGNSIKEDILFQVINYIHKNIQHGEKLKIETMAESFNFSPNYLGEYFKKHTGETLQQFIMQHKISLVEKRLQHSQLRLNEIAYELGFTDESHLIKSFKKYRGVSPKEFKKSSTG